MCRDFPREPIVTKKFTDINHTVDSRRTSENLETIGSPLVAVLQFLHYIYITVFTFTFTLQFLHLHLH